MALLEVDDVSVRFGGNLALKDVSFAAEASMVTGLIGPNGAGKTTAFNVITGLQEPTEGRVHLDGADITSLAPYQRAKRGMARTFQRLELFWSLSVRENLAVAAEVPGTAKGAKGTAKDRVADVIEQVGLVDFVDRRCDELTTGQARLAELARALITAPKVLLLDEPASGLDADETDMFARLLLSVANSGTALLLVEHDMPLVMRVCHQIYVLDYGGIIAVGPPAEIQRNQTVLEAYLGPGHEEVA